jgi:hypothetical protein
MTAPPADVTPRPEGPFRVLQGRDDDEWLLLDVESADPTYVAREALPDDVEVGNRVEADISWDGDEPVVESAAVDTETTFAFVRTGEPIFEAAQNCFEAARADGEAMNSRVTYNTDSEANGIVYTFADQPGSQDLLVEFRDGHKPLEPLVARAAHHEAVDPPFSVFVIDPEEPFVVVYVVFRRDGVLAETIRSTYGESG